MPYQRGAGMSEPEAARIASQVAQHQIGRATVERESHFFVVVVELPETTVTVRDDEDWRWLRCQVGLDR